MYLANATRPDIAFAVNYLARKWLNPTEDDWSDVKSVFRRLIAGCFAERRKLRSS